MSIKTCKLFKGQQLPHCDMIKNHSRKKGKKVNERAMSFQLTVSNNTVVDLECNVVIIRESVILY